MTTYNTYQEAKIANPESNIYIHTGEFWCEKSIRPSSWTYESRGFKLCNPADYCMTVEKFLADGYKFVEGDLVLGCGDRVMEVCGLIHLWNSPEDADARNLILRAAALEEKTEGDFWAELESSINEEKPRIKVEYVKVTDSIFDLRHDFEVGELFSKVSHARDYSTINNTQTLAQALHQSCCYRRIETPITWKEELYDYLDSSCEMSDDFDDSFTIEIEGKPLEFNLNDDEFVDMCKFVASLNSVN